MVSRNLLDTASRVLGINLANDQADLRAGSEEEQVQQAQEILRFALAAQRKGWTVHFVHQAPQDNTELYKHSAEVEFSSLKYKTVRFDSVEDIYNYYSNTVTVAASERGHGVMIPFGVRCATISIITHEKVKSFLDDIGHPEWGVEASADLRPEGAAGLADDLLAVLEHIDGNRQQVYDEIRAAQDMLMLTTARNMGTIAEIEPGDVQSSSANTQYIRPR
jgi:hypothetical protein